MHSDRRLRVLYFERMSETAKYYLRSLIAFLMLHSKCVLFVILYANQIIYLSWVVVVT